MRAFAQAERFVRELESRKLRAAYVFAMPSSSIWSRPICATLVSSNSISPKRIWQRFSTAPARPL